MAHAQNVKTLWEDIRECFSIVNEPQIQQRKANLTKCKQEDMPMAVYYGKLTVLWNELANCDQSPKCTCGGCKFSIRT